MSEMFYKLIHPILKFAMRFVIIHDIRTLNSLPSISGNAIYAVNHSNSHDVPIACVVIKRQAYVLSGKQRLRLMDRLATILNGAVWVDRQDKQSKQKAQVKMIRLLRRGESICIFPEGTWNLTPSKPTLPLYWGIIDLAREGEADGKLEKINELEDAFATLKWDIWEMFPVVHREENMKEQWEAEVQKRLAEYPLLDYEYEQGCVRHR